ncbi:MAG: hypothetical protein Q7T96_01620 [Methylobacter sp.]|nr:hypothetical protein [Methylobacter sp.]
MVLYIKQQIDLKEDSMELTPREKLNQYHTGPKIRDGNGIGFIAKPPEPPVPEQKPDPLAIAQTQIAEAYFGLAQILRGK